jgi:hypothetical protein
MGVSLGGRETQSDGWEILIANPEEFEGVDKSRWGGNGAKMKRNFELLPVAEQRQALDRFLDDCEIDQAGFHLCNCMGIEVMFFVLKPKLAVVVVNVSEDGVGIQ